MAWFKRHEPLSIAKEMNKIPEVEQGLGSEIAGGSADTGGREKPPTWDIKEFERVADERKERADQRVADWGAKLKLGWKLLRYAAPEMASAATHIAGEKVKQAKEDVVEGVRDKAVDMGENLSLLYKEVGDNARNTWESVSGAVSERKRQAVDKFHDTTEAIGNGVVGAYVVYKGARARISREVDAFWERRAEDAARREREQKINQLNNALALVERLRGELGQNVEVAS